MRGPVLAGALACLAIPIVALQFGIAAASATPPVDLGSAYVTDADDVLTDAEEEQANARLGRTFDETGIDLYVVFVDDFTDPSDRVDWANTTADANGLGDSQYLLAVSTEGRQYFISSLDTGPLSEADLSAVEERVLPELRDSDWSGAITAAAEGIEAERAAPGRTATIAVVAGAAVLGTGGAAFGIARSRRKRRDQRAEREAIERLERESGAALVAADDAVKSSAQEIEFARAQFGNGAITEFSAAVDAGRAQLMEAFGLRQQLDDAVPDSPEQQRAWLERIIELCAAVDAGLDAQADAFQRLRDIERNAPQALAALTERRRAAEAAVAAATAELGRLGTIYAADALNALTEAPRQASSLLAFAQEREALAGAAIGAGATPAAPADSATAAPEGALTASGRAALAIREAEAAVAQADGALRAIMTRGADLAAVEAACAALIAELEHDVATARSLEGSDGPVSAAAAATEQQVALARADLTGSERRPDRALQALEAANAAIDSAIQAGRETARTRQLVAANLAQASEQIRQAEAYIEAARGVVDASSRTRIAEARAAYARAEAAQQADPQSALRDARRASELAAEAQRSAEWNVSQSRSGGYGGYGGSPASGGSDLSAILGGIIGGAMNGGFSGGYGGSRSRSGSWGGSSSRSRSRSSGSSGRRSRSSGGSRRRSGGGRF